MSEPKKPTEEKKDKYDNLIVNEQFGNRLMSLSLKTGNFKDSVYHTIIITSANCTTEGSPITENKRLENGQFAPVVKSQSIQIPKAAFKEFLAKVNTLMEK